MRSPFWRILLPILVLLSALPLPAARAQEIAASPTALTGAVQIESDFFGVAGVVRPGDLAGVRLVLTDRGDRVRDTIVRLSLSDPDGDQAFIERAITLNPGRPQPLWLYAQLPAQLDRLSLFTITVHEADTSGGSVRAGRQIAAGRIAPQRVVSLTDGLIAVVGRRGAGLETYTVRDDSGAPTPTTNEIINTITGVEPEDLPDEWMGLASFDALVWLEGDPTALRADQASALREWISRGGRLVVVLPSVGQLWTNNVNPLLDVMPAMIVTQREGVDLSAYRRLLTNRPNLPLPRRAVVRVFEPSPFARPDDAIPILAGPDGATIAMRRLLGLGDVTVVGIDLDSPALTGRIDAQVVWHRLLGKRFDVRSRSALESASVKNFPRPAAAIVDAPIAGLINKTGSAGVGVLLGLIVFAAYFLLAGPLGFGLLSKWKWRRHAWVMFMGVAAVFTAIAWGGASLIKPKKTNLTHITFLDGVSGQNLVRARSWFSVLMPTYGSQTVALGDPDAAALGSTALHNVLWPWQSPAPGARAAFPDQRQYTIDSRRPDSIRVPTRSTVKEFEARWIGPPPWRLPRPVDGEITIDANGSIVGSIMHELPAALEHVVIVVNRGQTPMVDLRDGGPLLANVWAWSPYGSTPWLPGASFDLSTLDYRDAATGAEFFNDLKRGVEPLAGAISGDTSQNLSRVDRQLEAITWFSALEQPEWKSIIGSRAVVRRRITHTLDLSRWLTQPCLIVVGQLPVSEIPIPLTVDGVTPASTGRTVVRWVYPLASDPPRPLFN